jgi:hypothetical protein
MARIPGEPIYAQQHTSGVQTVDIITLPIPENCIRTFEVCVLAKSGADGKCYNAQACVNRQAAAPALVGTPRVDTPMATAGASTWPNPSAAIVGNDVVFRVTGVATREIEWLIEILGNDFNL